MAKQGKRYRENAKGVDRETKYALPEALSLALGSKRCKFDETVEVAVRLGVDPRQADQNVRGTVILPAGTGKNLRVLVFAKGEKAKEAESAGADIVGAEDLVKKIQEESWLEFDKVVATPDMMAQVGRIGKILGPRGLMPNPKVGTVTLDVGKQVREIKSGKVEFRVDKGGIVHAPIGKASFGPEKLLENANALIDALVKAKPSASKGVYLKSITVATTMGPGVKVDPLAARTAAVAAA